MSIVSRTPIPPGLPGDLDVLLGSGQGKNRAAATLSLTVLYKGDAIGSLYYRNPRIPLATEVDAVVSLLRVCAFYRLF